MSEYFINALKHTGGQDTFLRYLQKVNSVLMLTELHHKQRGVLIRNQQCPV